MMIDDCVSGQKIILQISPFVPPLHLQPIHTSDIY